MFLGKKHMNKLEVNTSKFRHVRRRNLMIRRHIFEMEWKSYKWNVEISR